MTVNIPGCQTVSNNPGVSPGNDKSEGSKVVVEKVAAIYQKEIKINCRETQNQQIRPEFSEETF